MKPASNPWATALGNLTTAQLRALWTALTAAHAPETVDLTTIPRDAARTEMQRRGMPL